MLMYAANIYFWRRYRINYTFIFGFKQGTELGYRDVLMLGFGLAVLALASVLANLDMEMDPRTKDYKALTELVPLGLVVVRIVKQSNIPASSPAKFINACAVCSTSSFFPGLCSLYLSYASSLSTLYIVQVASSLSQVCFTASVLLYTR